MTAPDGLTSVIRVLRGTLTPAVHRPEEPNAFGPHSAVPYVHSAGPVVSGDVYAVAIALTADPAGPGDPPQLGPATDQIVWADGERTPLSLPAVSANQDEYYR